MNIALQSAINIVLDKLQNNTEEIKVLILATEHLKEEYYDRNAIMNLLHNIVLFLEQMIYLESK